MDKVRWGVLSTANIGVEHVIPGMQKSKLCSVEAICSRKKEKADEVAAKLDISKSYGSYEELLQDDEIDAIYNPLPNHLHVTWTLKALEAGKHVLCEKPIGLNTSEAKKLLEATKEYPNLHVMEAFMYRFHPQWEQVKKWIADGEIGTVKTIQSAFTYYNDNPDDIRNKAGIGGGGLLDMGCYCLSASRFLFDAEPLTVYGEIENDPDFKVDRLASGILTFPEGTATFTCSTQASPEQHLTAFGSDGLIEMDIPFNPLENTATIYLKKDGKVVEEQHTQDNHYTLQGDAFSKSILDSESVPPPLGDALAIMKVMEAIFWRGEV